MGSSGIRCRARLRTYKRLIVGHVMGFKTLTPSIRGLIMPEHYFWLSDTQFARRTDSLDLQPRPDSLDLLPNKVRGVPRVDDRKVISGIIHVIRYGLMWRDAPSCYGSHKNALQPRSWSKAGVFNRIFQALAAESTATGTLMIDTTHLKADRTAASLLKKGLFRAISDVPEAASTRSSTPSATALAGP